MGGDVSSRPVGASRRCWTSTFRSPARFLLDVIHLIHGTAEVTGKAADLRRRASEYLDALTAFQDAWAAAANPDGRISLAMAREKSGRDRLEEFLRTASLRLRQTRRLTRSTRARIARQSSGASGCRRARWT